MNPLRFKFKTVLATLALGAALAPSARADVWAYVDANGVAHFTTEQQDERYELFFRDGESPGAETSLKKKGTPRPVAVPTAPARLIAFFEISPSYKQVRHHLREASRTHGIDFELLQALIATESGFNAGAVSPKGAVGLMQVMPATARRYGVSAGQNASVEKKLADPRTNIRAGARYLRHLLNLFPGRTDLALAAYNAGEGAVQRAGNRIPNYRETQNYVKTVLQLHALLKPPSLVTAGGHFGNRVRMVLPGAPPASAALGRLPARRNLPPEGAPAMPVAVNSPGALHLTFD